MAISRFPRKRLQGRNCDGVAENKICFSDKEAAYIQATLQHREGVPIQIEKELSGFWFHRTNWESELRIIFLSTFRLTVSRVCFIHRRCGTMTEIGAYLEAFCHTHQIPELVIQCVETPEMVNWCNKNGFSPIPSASMIFDGIIMGDYRKIIEGENT